MGPETPKALFSRAASTECRSTFIPQVPLFKSIFLKIRFRISEKRSNNREDVAPAPHSQVTASAVAMENLKQGASTPRYEKPGSPGFLLLKQDYAPIPQGSTVDKPGLAKQLTINRIGLRLRPKPRKHAGGTAIFFNCYR
jgi:hypothetical protein